MVGKKLLVLFLLLISISYACHEKENNIALVTTSSVEADLKEQVSKYPDSLPLRVKLIQLYSDSSDYKNATKVIDDAIKRDSANPELWNIKGSVLYQSEDTMGAITAFERAISIIPLPDYLISIGSLYAQTKNPKALQLADDLLGDKNAKAEKEAFFIKGLYYSYTGEKARSIEFFDHCIQMNYTFMPAYREKGISLYDLGKYDEAITVLTRAVTIQNSFDEGYYWLGKCDEKLNKKQEAIDNYKTALLYDKDFVEARNALNHLTSK